MVARRSITKNLNFPVHQFRVTATPQHGTSYRQYQGVIYGKTGRSLWVGDRSRVREKRERKECARGAGDGVEGDGSGYSKDIPDAVVKFAGLARSITGRVFWQRAKR